MKTSTHLGAAVICLLAMVGCDQSSPTGPLSYSLNEPSSAPSAHSRGLRFHAQYSTTFTFGAIPGQIFVQGTGTGTGLETSTLAAEQFVNPTVIPNTLTGVSLVITAGDGSELHGVYAGLTGPPLPPPPAPPAETLRFEGDFTITGGTGRFAGATGNGRFAGSARTRLGTGNVSWKGTIFLPNN